MAMDILFGTLRHVILAAADTRCHENPREGATAELTDRPPGKPDHLEVELCHHGTGRAELLSVEEALGRPGAAAEARERAGEHDARAPPTGRYGARGRAAGVPLHEAASLGAALNRLEHPRGAYRREDLVRPRLGSSPELRASWEPILIRGHIELNRGGKPTDNASPSNPLPAASARRARARTGFESIEEAKGKIDAWPEDYNEPWPHRALESLTPRELALKSSAWVADSRPGWSENLEPVEKATIPRRCRGVVAH